MIKAISELNKYKSRLNTVLSELESLEDGQDADYQECIIDLRGVVLMLEQRRERLQKRGRTQWGIQWVRIVLIVIIVTIKEFVFCLMRLLMGYVPVLCGVKEIELFL